LTHLNQTDNELSAKPSSNPSPRNTATNPRWSAKEGDVPYGDPDLHHSVGILFASEDDVPPAERHLLLGTKASPTVLATLLYDYFSEDLPHTAGLYLARAVLPYLCLGNLRDATVALNVFVGKLAAAETAPVRSTIEGVLIFPALPLVNFLSLLCVACQRGAAEFFYNLKKQYARSLEEVPWDDVPPSPPSSITPFPFLISGLTGLRPLQRLEKSGSISKSRNLKGI
jgi:Golgi to ER traffic protein 4